VAGMVRHVFGVALLQGIEVIQQWNPQRLGSNSRCTVQGRKLPRSKVFSTVTGLH